MPIFDNNGKKQNVQDAHVEKYMELYPDATTIMERDGKKYRVKAKDYNTFMGDTLRTAQETPKATDAPMVTAPQQDVLQTQTEMAAPARQPMPESEYLGKIALETPNTPVEGDIYRGEYGTYTRTEVPYKTKEYASLEDAKAGRELNIEVSDEEALARMRKDGESRAAEPYAKRLKMSEPQEDAVRTAMAHAKEDLMPQYPYIVAEEVTDPLFKEFENRRGRSRAAESNEVVAQEKMRAMSWFNPETGKTEMKEDAFVRADDLGLIDMYTREAKKRILADREMKARAQENADALGMKLEDYVDAVAVPALQERMWNEWIVPQEEEARKNYNALDAMWDNSIMGMLDSHFGVFRPKPETDTDRYLNMVGQEEWSKNASLLERAGGFAGAMALDLPFFGGLGKLASVPAQYAGKQALKQMVTRETQKMVARGVSEAAAKRYANYAVKNGLKNRIMLNLSTAPLQSGLTFGMFDAGKAAINMSLNDEWNWGELGKSAAGGTLLGGALGLTGAVGGGLTHGLTGAAKYAGKVAEFGVENAVFTEGGRLIGKLHGEQPENGWLEDYVESAATLLMIKTPNIVKNIASIKGNKEASEVFAFNKLEREQLAKYGKDLNAVLEGMLPRNENVAVEGKGVSLDGINEGRLTEEYIRVMNDAEIPMTTKAKLMAVVEGKAMMPPRVTDANVEGKRVMTYDPMGRLVEIKEYKNDAAANKELEKLQPAMDRNLIGVLEDMYIRIKGYEVDDVTVREWLAKNPDVKAEDVATIVAKDNAGEPLTKAEQKVLDSMRQARREGLNDASHLNKIVAALEDAGINAKDVMTGIDKPMTERTETEQRAVNAYRNILIHEVGDMFKETAPAGDVNGGKNPGTDIVMRTNESDRSVDETANNGMVYTTTAPSGEKIIITGGKVVLDNEGYIDVNQSEGLVALMPDGSKKPVKPGDLREKLEVSNAEELKAAKREEIKQEVAAENGWKVLEPGVDIEIAFDGDVYKLKVEGRDERGDIILSGEGESMAIPESAVQEGIKEAERLRNAEVASPTAEEAATIEGGEAKAESSVVEAPVEQPGLSNEAQQPQAAAPKVAEVSDFFRMDGKNYVVASRNEDGSVNVIVDGKRVILPAETDFSAAVPTDKRGEVLFTEMPAEKTLEYFVQRVPNGRARAQMIENNRKQAESALKKFDKEPNVGTDPDAYEATMNKWEADKTAAQAKVDYWNEVAERDAEISQSEMRESVKAVKPREVAEMTPEEFVANQLSGIKITPESFQKETGTKAEQKQMVGVIAGKEKGGVSIERAAEIIYENYDDELRGLGFNGDMQDVRDIIIDVLSYGNPRSFAKKGLEMRQQADVEQQLAELRDVANALNFESIEEQIAYEESIVPRIIQKYTGFDETEYFNNLAENYENDTTRESESTRGSSELLQGEQPADNAGVADLGEPGQGGKVQGDVYSGGENATPQGNQQVSSSEIPNSSTVSQASDQVSDQVAEADAPGQSGVAEIKEPTFTEEVLENGDKRITKYNSRGEVEAVSTERDGKIISVDSYDDGVLFEHTEYDGNGVSTSVTRYDKNGDVVAKQEFKQKAELQQGVLEFDRENPAFERATENVRKKLEATGVKVKVLTKEEAEKALAELEAMNGVEKMSVSEAKKRADAIESLSPINITSNTKTKEELNADYKSLPSVKKGGKMIEFYNSAFKKIYKEGGLFAQIVPQLDKILEQSVMAYYENDNLGGIVRPDGTVHKAHPNISKFYNYIGKVKIGGKEYYVRTTVKEEISGQSGTHSYMVTDVSLYDKTTKSLSLPITTRARGTLSGIVDAKLKDFFDYANGITKNPEFMKTFHGSGAQFDKFDHSFMGTGEGAQVFGWGTYVTEVEDIGRTYAGVGVTKLGSLQAKLGNIDSAISLLEKEVQRAEKDLTSDNETVRHIAAYTLDTASERRKALEEEKAAVEEEIKSYRNLYTVEIPDDNGSNYLHWEERINGEIQERIANGLQSIGFEIEPDMNHLAYSRDGKIAVLNINAKGKDLYAELSEALGGDKAASQFLNEMGFVGISYPAEAMTGGRKDGARNYVIFNEDDAQIEGRIEFLRTSDGTTYGWAVNGEIYLTPEGLNPNTPIHEYTHLWASALQKSNPKLWGEVVEAMKLSPVWNEVMADDNYTDIHGDDNRVASEVLSRLSGNEGYRRYMEQAEKEIAAERDIVGKVQKKGILNRIRNAVSRFWNWLKGKLGSKAKAGDSTEAKTEPWEEFVNKSLKDFDEGVNPDAYMRAVENGDMETAERLVKEAAKRAMPDTKVVDEDGYPMVVYHGSNYEFTVFGENIPSKRAHTHENSYFFSGHKVVSEDYGNVIYGSFLNMENPLVVDFEGRNWRNTKEVISVYYARNYEILKSGFGSEEEAAAWREEFLKNNEDYGKDADYVVVGNTFESVGPSTDEYVRKAQLEGYDGLIVKNVVDAAGGGWVLDENGTYTIRETEGTRTVTTDYVAFSPNQIKSADVVTYDDNGNVIPLSERFNEEKEDIRFSKANENQEIFVSNARNNLSKNTNFANTYKTEDGKDINYTSERAEGYGVQGGGTGNSYDGTGNSILQRQTDTGVPGANSGLNEDKGEFCVVERVFTENGAFNFTSGEKIESADDVAYIFSALEDAAKEHSFVVYVKDGKPTVIELGMGSFNATMVDIPTASLAYSRINPDHVYFVHNHPSGNLVCSAQDVAMLRVFEDMSDVPVTGVIINLKTGKYGTFDTERHSVIGEKRVPENEERLTVHTLDKQIFAPDYDPMAQPLVRSSQDVAQFLNSQRMGDRPKVSFLILSRANRIIGNIHTPFTDITTDIEAVARYINERVIQFGGENAILYGDFAISYDESGGFRLLQNAMERFGKTKLLDVVHVEGNFTKSAIDLGLLYEPETDYGVVKESEQGYGSTEQDIPVDEVESKPLTFAEKITNSVLEASAKNKENLALRSDALRMFGRDVANVLKLMGKQREYDKSTVDQLVKLAKMYFKDAQLLGGLTPYQVGRVMTRLNNAVGKRDITDDANELVNILVDAHNKELENMLEKQAKTKAKKVNASGVEVIGKLDKEGQLLLEEYNAGKELDLESIDDKIIDLQNEAAEGKAEEAAARIRGLELARQYREEILKKRDEIKGLEQELKDVEKDVKDGVMTKDAYKEFRRATKRAIVESKLEMVDAYHGLIHGLGGDISSSAKRAKLFQQQQIDHVKEIQHNANIDLLGHPADAQGETPDKWNSSVPRFFMSAMPTFQTMLKFFGEKAADGRGYLYERFIPQHTQASHNEYIGKTEAREKMRKKLTEIFGKKTSIEKFMDMSRKDGAVLEYQEGGEKKTIDLTRGQVLYLYMINKMADGQMKLSRMGITDADVQKMAKELPEEMVRFADWVQEEFLTELREKYNKVHERMFGAPMAAIESYFPIKINKRSRGEKIEPGMNAEDKPSTVTGSVIKRTKNAVAIDLNADAMQVLLGHIDDMENWAAWAEFRRDVKSLLNYRHFQNQVKGMESLRYGSGEKLWKNFVDVANIAAGSYKTNNSNADKLAMNIAKGFVSSKIAFRYFTALKQILSTPAFWSEADLDKMIHAYLHQKEAWDWAIKELPGFRKRWEGRAAGNEILLESDSDWETWRNRMVDKLSKEGMRANAFIDALTVATGAKAVFETKYEMFKKAGYSEERAKEKALNRAAEAYNESQQSSESAYLSPLQADRTWLTALLAAYRNSPFGYNRKGYDAVAGLKKMSKKGYKQESIDFMVKQIMRDGINEEQAKRFAEIVYKRSKARHAANAVLFLFFLNYIWELGPDSIYGLLGDDDEKKKEQHLEDLLDGVMGGFSNLPAGGVLVGAIKAMATQDASKFQLPKAVATQDIENLADVMQMDFVRGVNELLNAVVAARWGFNPQTFTDMLVAFSDIEGFNAEELGMLIMRMANFPNSQLELLEADKAMENYGEKMEEITREYAEYQKSKRAPLTGWLYSDESEQKAIERYEKRFKKILDERFESIVENTDEYDMWYENSDPQMKAKLAKLRQKFLEGDKETTMEKLDSIDVTKKVLFGSGYDEVNTVYYELSTAEDEDMAMMIDTKLKELQPMMDEYNKLRGDDRKTYRGENLEQIQFYNKLNGRKNDVNNLKGVMKKKPEEAQEKMEKIRKIRTKAIDLINNYNE